jgi:D-alanyl-D-alanine carboxypeptidase (penicillin-binding protein 5/6)
MTLLLIMEAVDSGKLSLDSMVTVSENAASMGGSQVYLEVGETMSADELIKCVVIASANDAALTLAEAVAGSEEAFVAAMNKRSQELGMKSTNFENVTGLDDDTTAHLTSAMDIALMSRELMKHKKIFEYSTLWMDSIRNGAFGLTNTNRLIRFYNGATGLKTGSTSKAGFCISATAEREGLHLIAVIMGSKTRDERNEAAKTLLDYGFANYSVYSSSGGDVGEITVTGGDFDNIRGVYGEISFLVPKGKTGQVKCEYDFAPSVKAPVAEKQKVGTVRYSLDGQVICERDVLSDRKIDKLSFKKHLFRLLGSFLLK